MSQLPAPQASAVTQYVDVIHLLDNARLMVMLLDERGLVTFINEQGRRVLAGHGEVAGHQFISVLADDGTQQRVNDRLAQLLRGHQTHFNHESEVAAADGSSLIVDWHHTRLDRRGEGCAVLCIGVDVTARRKAEKNLAWLADHDPLTKIYNRRRFEADLDKLLRRAARYGHGGALLYFDIDEFKLINDTGGHKVGDELLSLIGGRLRRFGRATDMPARLGGDEFAVVLDETGPEDAARVAERLVRNLSSLKILLGNSLHHVSISLGMVLYPQHGQTVQELLANADFAMYQAKRRAQATGRWHCFSECDTEREMMRRRVDWRARIEEALANDRLTLVYQPVVGTHDGAVHHYEALMRFRGENDELLAPSPFIDAAETCGLVTQIDTRALELACQELARWRRQDLHVTLAINLSAQTLDRPGFVGLVTEQLDRYQLHPVQLSFEITERSAVENMEAAQRMMQDLQRLGCTFALDDFGVGFSSWLYLKQLPVNFLKLDGSLIRQMASNRADQLFVKAMNEMSHALGLRTIAESVEDEGTLALLRTFGIDLAQGYCLGKPTPRLIHEVARGQRASLE
ncbi:MAG TPA: bifunctional diguanylate cyclase/phosphodiesterase [Burkholderiaceae bacterium]|nr:bifunctional diguanylate cyclase/phosphodiesterase [Burkholderiaceae bacterium]